MTKQDFSKETFWSLLKDNSIVIPIIQRAYTQGGRGNDKIVEKKGMDFLKYIADALRTNTTIELDFIYGTVEGGKIQPLDGQQRLTTLFLLHWYIGQKENSISNDDKKRLKRFTYETRSSSRYFCRKLCDFEIPKDNASLPLSQTIENQPWFVLSWKNDPSVLSMLSMLDKIHDELNNYPNPLWNRLISSPDNAIITFFYTPLEAFNLTDELYIKMNARGKELTAFENFKAAIEKTIDEEKWDNDKEADKKFGNLMDNEWTDLFWQFRVPVESRDKQTNYTIDKQMLRFFSALLINHYAGIDQDKTNNLFNSPEVLSSDDFSEDSYTYLYDMTNLFHAAWRLLKDDKTINTAYFWWENTRVEMKTFSDFFKLFVGQTQTHGNTMTWQQRALFYGFSLYLQNNKHIEIEKLSDWLRFVRNIITNGTTIDAYTPFVSAKKRLDKFARRSGYVYSHISTAKATNGYAAKQVKEEIWKARIYMNILGVKHIIQELEDCNFCRGRIQFALDCLGIVDTVTDITALETMKNVFLNYLNGCSISDDFRRAMFVCDEGYYYYWGPCDSFNEGKYCLIDGRDDLVSVYAYPKDLKNSEDSRKRKECLKKLLLLLCQSDLNAIVKSYQPTVDTPNWKKRLITEPGLLEKCKKHLITIPWENEDDHCYLLYGQKPSESYYYGSSYEEIR